MIPGITSTQPLCRLTARWPAPADFSLRVHSFIHWLSIILLSSAVWSSQPAFRRWPWEKQGGSGVWVGLAPVTQCTDTCYCHLPIATCKLPNKKKPTEKKFQAESFLTETLFPPDILFAPPQISADIFFLPEIFFCKNFFSRQNFFH